MESVECRMMAMAVRLPSPLARLATLAVALVIALAPSAAQVDARPPVQQAPVPIPAPAAPAAPTRATPSEASGTRPPDFNQMRRDQAATDRAWRTASDGFMTMEKITYRSSVGDLDIPAFVFQAAEARRARKASRDRLGAREHPRPPLRTLHSLRPRRGRERLRRHRAGVSRQRRLRQDVLRCDRLRRRAKSTTS